MDKETYIDNDIVKFEVQWIANYPFLHLQAKQWSHKLYKEYYIPTWNEFQKYLKTEHDVSHALVVMEKGETKQRKFLEKFGFRFQYEDGNLLALSKELKWEQ